MSDIVTSESLNLGKVLQVYAEAKPIATGVDEEHIHGVIEEYLAALSEVYSAAILSLFADDAQLVDPVGSRPCVGKKAIEKFVGSMLHGCRNPKLAAPIRTCIGNIAAVAFSIEFVLGDIEAEISIIDIVRFNSAGKIISLEAHWGLDDIHMIRGDRGDLVAAFMPGKDPKDQADFQSHMRKAMQQYIDSINLKDPAGLLKMYSEDVVAVDPMGTVPLHGLKTIASFYDQGMADRVDLECSIRTSFGRTAAMAFKVIFPMEGRKIHIHTIDVMTFDEAGRIIDIKAIWGRRNVKFKEKE